MADVVVGLIGGTGLGQALAKDLHGETCDMDTPFGRPSAPILRGKWEDVDIAFLPRHGVGHTHCPSAVPYRANIYALKALGVTHIIASGATGSLREEMRPRDLVIPDQVIDKTTQRVGTFFDQPGVVAHVEFAQPFSPVLRKTILACADQVDCTVHDGGTYVCMEGPAFSTIAESRMHRSWGGDLIGMTCMPEAKLAREAEIAYASICLPTDYDCWRPHEPGKNAEALLAEIISNVHAATQRSVELMRAVLKKIAKDGIEPCITQQSLDLAVWTQPEHISPESRKRLGVLLDRYIKNKEQA